MPYSSRPPCLDHSNYTWRGLQIRKLLIMQFSPGSCYFIPLAAPYSQSPSVYFLPLISGATFHTHAEPLAKL
jgi:hypothetical protein